MEEESFVDDIEIKCRLCLKACFSDDQINEGHQSDFFEITQTEVIY